MKIPEDINARARRANRDDEWLIDLWRVLQLFGAREAARVELARTRRAWEIERERNWGIPPSASDEERELCWHEAMDVAEQRERDEP